MTGLVVSDLLAEIRDRIGCLHKLAECVGMLDMLASYAHDSIAMPTRGAWARARATPSRSRALSRCRRGASARPVFTDTLAVKQAQHPLLARTLSRPYVPNDLIVSPASNFLLITGPNMVRWLRVMLRNGRAGDLGRTALRLTVPRRAANPRFCARSPCCKSWHSAACKVRMCGDRSMDARSVPRCRILKGDVAGVATDGAARRGGPSAGGICIVPHL